jgi:ribulose-5-phosphate 4-epimerase/fuculose-1-phosphate aldolase
LAYIIDPRLKSAKVLAEYALSRDRAIHGNVLKIIKEHGNISFNVPELMQGPFQTQKESENAVIEAGKAVSEMGFTETVFGNISTVFDDVLYISTTGSDLKNLENSISYCDLEGKSLNGKNPSSELPSHLRIVKETNSRCVLHAHPFFTIVYSMIKGINSTMFGVPITGGDIGGGENGMVHTVPPYFKEFNIVAVHAHGVFAVDCFDFNGPLKSIWKLESLCRKRYIEKYL